MKYKEIFTSTGAWIAIVIWFAVAVYGNFRVDGYVSIGEKAGLLISTIFLYFLLASIFWLIYHWREKEIKT